MTPRGNARRPCVHVAADAVDERTDRLRLGGAVDDEGGRAGLLRVQLFGRDPAPQR
jgi:hypothetical protein